ncbi:hypothetical protein [Curtobacterium sp. VKM Ac-2884]|uniref:hypothetical protein n=1 Tax=Curtobacterium sp. VKM Ac-2884 TaxID=2783818 RepID=UPI00188D356D|nr:hypothetical protein [Curtobacterium sp. VKM Ac-2884]MBF4603727.1 hypothetical protein [Curtobacterium sp. VKM Ac-2884]
MSGADLLEDSFSGHGTTAGYDAGCRSLGGCPGKDGPWAQTCMTAKSRSRMEFGYSKAVAKDREVEFLQAEADARTESVKPTQKVAAAKRAQRKAHRVPAPEVIAEEPEPSAPASVPDVNHGTTHGYARGCRDAETCPGGDDGRSCVQAQQDYQREYRARKRAELQEQRGEVSVVADVASAVVPEPVVESVEEPRPRGKRVLDDAMRTLAESLELQRALAEIGERALRSIRIEINHLRREVAAREES